MEYAISLLTSLISLLGYSMAIIQAASSIEKFKEKPWKIHASFEQYAFRDINIITIMTSVYYFYNIANNYEPVTIYNVVCSAIIIAIYYIKKERTEKIYKILLTLAFTGTINSIYHLYTLLK